ncbi:hypothetical protein Acsp04_24800 [Actinomadura sp. NBRC 104425]|nr:hypothetical protein Acsp04_24800 [Actinomadura sp. NBRC 104425]
MALAHPPRDQLGVLRAEVDDENGVKGLVCGHQGAFRDEVGAGPFSLEAPACADARPVRPPARAPRPADKRGRPVLADNAIRKPDHWYL